jgi:hypothetical protein
MTCHRTTARGILFLLTLCGAAVVSACALAATGAKQPAAPIVFPVIGPATYSDDFGDPRGSSRHEGNDLMAPRRAIAVAAEAGTVKFWTTSANAGCMLYLEADSGTTYLYIHLNNDLGAGNDNKGKCVPGVAYAAGLASGDHVEAGQPVGFVGDSGDADGINPHLHFEVHPNGGKAVNPYKLLRKASRLLFWEPEGTRFSLVLDGTVVAAAPDSLTLRVTLLRQWPSHQKATNLDRPLTLNVPVTAQITRTVASAAAAPLDEALPGQKVRVWTGLLTADDATRSGTTGALTASKILLR